MQSKKNTSPTLSTTVYNGNKIIGKNRNYSQIEWNNDVYNYTKNNNYPVWSNFGANGCGTCTAAEVISNLCGEKITPCDIIDTEYELSGHKRSKTADGSQLFGAIANEYGCTSKKITTPILTESYMQEVLHNGGQIAHTKTMQNGQTHYIAIVGYNTNNNKYIIFDPWTKFNNSVYREYTYDEYISYRNGGIGNQAHVLYKNIW